MNVTLFPLPTRTLAVDSPVGWWTVTVSGDAVSSLDYAGEQPEHCHRPESKLEKRLDCMLSRYFKGETVDFGPIPVVFPERPPLLGKAMRAIREIPYGQAECYQWVAERTGNPSATRAVGSALGRNPVPIIIPCHRIIAKNETLGGFMRGHADGPRIKTFLLSLEGHRFINGKKA